jgi:hypothetical protein
MAITYKFRTDAAYYRTLIDRYYQQLDGTVWSSRIDYRWHFSLAGSCADRIQGWERGDSLRVSLLRGSHVDEVERVSTLEASCGFR